MDAFIGSIILFAGNFAPRGWAFCAGQILSIAQNTALFSLLGTTYGGNGQTTFALPDLRGRVPVGSGQGPGLANISLGEAAGEPNHTLLQTEIPAHSHNVNCSNAAGDSATPGSRYPAAGLNKAGDKFTIYSASQNTVMNPATIGATGSSQPHNNMQPYLGLNYIICMEGIFPSRN